VDLASTGLGSILVNSQGRTLYLFEADSGARSACTDACAVAWPPLIAHGKPTVGSGVNGSLVGTAKRSDGTEQVTYNGHPLYLFVKDTKADQTAGQGVTAFGAPWYVLSAAGDSITTQPSTASSSTSGGSNVSGY
jgi:predicted lipoprotein with Yx(FWY)xxD motif